MQPKVKQLIKTSKEVILDCCLENGAIVAANSDKEYYPQGVEDYRYVWLRDAAFALYAANLLRMKRIQEPFIKWLLNRAEGFSARGAIFERYLVNGPGDPRWGRLFQPDQAGALIWSLLAINKRLKKDTKEVVRILADNLCRNWGGGYFKVPTRDIWEDKRTRTLPVLRTNYMYSLAACSFGLERAYQRLGRERYLQVSNQMKNILKKSGRTYYPKSWGRIPRPHVDASIIGLVWPFQVLDTDPKLLTSIEMVKEKLLTPQGIKRYEGDRYDGMIKDLKLCYLGGGGWPVLTFWYIIALAKLNKKGDARRLFNKYIKNFKDNYIPEQLFDNKTQVSISPLMWSHAMFVIAAKELGYI